MKNKKVKICILLHALVGGGAERFILHLANNLSRDIFDIYLILLKKEGEYLSMLAPDIKIVDLNLKAFKLSQPPNPLWLFKLSKAFREINPDLIFSTMTTTNLMAIIARFLTGLKMPLIIQEAGILGDHLKFERLGFFKKIIYQFLVPGADLIAVLTPAMAADLQNLTQLKPEKIRVIPNILDIDFIERNLKAGPIPSSVKIPKDLKIIISMGRFEKIKGFDIGIRAFYELQRKIPCCYWLLGQGREEGNLRKLASDLGIEQRVNFLGFQQNPYPFLRAANCFLLPSRSEGLPYTLLEAMCCELPCVASEYNLSVRDIVKHGENGLIVESDNPGKMAEAIESILADKGVQDKFKVNGKRTIEAYSAQKIVPQYEQLFLSHAGSSS